MQHTADSKVSPLVRLTLYENLLIGQEKSVCCLHQWVSILSRLNLWKIEGLSSRTKKTVHNNVRGVRKAEFDCDKQVWAYGNLDDYLLVVLVFV